MVTPTPRLIYEGSVKNLWSAGAGELEFEYTDAYSVFDWGRMPDVLAYKGESLAAIGSYFFEHTAKPEVWGNVKNSKWLTRLHPDLRHGVEHELKLLEAQGLRSHFVKQTAPKKILVKEVAVHRPQVHGLGQQTLVHYSDSNSWSTASRLIPLEVVFRFGMPKGSSLSERLTTQYAQNLGFKTVPIEGEFFDQPVIEFFSKLEDTDRFLSWEQALNYSGLAYEQFTQLLFRSIALAVWLNQFFENKGLELWDGKFEWALLDGALTLVDSIGPDELRLMAPGRSTQISKEFLRLYYRQTKWFEEVKVSKMQSALDPTLDWQKQVRSRVGQPPALTPAVRAVADVLYPSLALAVTGTQNPGAKAIALPQLFERIDQCLAR